MRVRHELRLLHVRSQYGYTSRPSEAMSLEPEAVPPEFQRELTKRAAQTALQRDSDVMRASQERIGAELAHMLALAPGKRIASHLRAMQRQLAQLDQQLRKSSHS